jgi:hypothetical protein
MSEALSPLLCTGAASQSRYFFNLSGNEETFKVTAFESLLEDPFARQPAHWGLFVG